MPELRVIDLYWRQLVRKIEHPNPLELLKSIASHRGGELRGFDYVGRIPDASRRFHLDLVKKNPEGCLYIVMSGERGDIRQIWKAGEGRWIIDLSNKVFENVKSV